MTSRKVFHITGYCLVAFLAGACNKASSDLLFSESVREPTSPTPPDKASSDDAERVDPPSNISGTFLYCEEKRSESTVDIQSVTHCVLQDNTSHSKVNLDTSYSSHQWKAEVPDLDTLEVSKQELSDDPLWHYELKVKAGNALLLELALQGARVSLSVESGNSSSQKASQSVLTIDPGWLSLNGDRVPTIALQGGTEHAGLDPLTICRIYQSGGVFPGKLLPHYKNSNKSSCYSTFQGEKLISQSDDSKTALLKSDVLVATGSGSSSLAWTAMQGGSFPPGAMVAGIDELGEALYLCRNLEAGPPPASSDDQPNDPAGEWTPGYAKASTGFCQHEYYGQKTSTSYEVLVRK